MANKDIVYQMGDKEMRLSPSGTELLAEGIKQIHSRVEKENQAKASIEVILDNSNKVAFPGFPYKFEALGEKILVSIDIFKSGYECKICKGKKVIKYFCPCELNGHKGLKYSDDDLKTVAATLGEDIALARQNLVCPECNGEYELKREEKNCEDCKGLGTLLHIPDISKNLPTTGIVVSIGSACKGLSYKIGDRILFGPYAGSMIPTKAGLMFKIIDATQAWARIEGGEDLSAFEFIIQE
jgi:co-chaperonin GroES (HSP10)